MNIQHIKTLVHALFVAMSDDVNHKLSRGNLREGINAQNGEKEDKTSFMEPPRAKGEGCERTVGKTPDGSSE